MTSSPTGFRWSSEGSRPSRRGKGTGIKRQTPTFYPSLGIKRRRPTDSFFSPFDSLPTFCTSTRLLGSPCFAKPGWSCTGRMGGCAARQSGQGSKLSEGVPLKPHGYLFFPLFFFSDAEFVHHFSFKDLEPSYIALDGAKLASFTKSYCETSTLEWE